MGEQLTLERLQELGGLVPEQTEMRDVTWTGTDQATGTPRTYTHTVAIRRMAYAWTMQAATQAAKRAQSNGLDSDQCWRAALIAGAVDFGGAHLSFEQALQLEPGLGVALFNEVVAVTGMRREGDPEKKSAATTSFGASSSATESAAPPSRKHKRD